jgi:hypothetical protein
MEAFNLMKVQFPVFILAKDCAEITCFESIQELQRQLEEIDVQNEEYLAWDKVGNPVKLSVQKPLWLKLEMVEDSSQPSLRDSLQKYAATLGIKLDILGENQPDFVKIYGEFQKHGDEKASLMRRLFGR